MSRVLKTWMWSLGFVARSYRVVVLLAALIALWIFGAYEWLGMPAESSPLLLGLSLLWALVQLLAAAIMVGGMLAGAGETSTTDVGCFPVKSLWTLGRKKMIATLVYSFLSMILAWVFSTVFDWINSHSVEVASFLTFHSQKPVSHVLIEHIYAVIEGVLWIILSGFLLSFFIAMLRDGLREAGRKAGELLAGCAFRAPLLTNILSVVIFGGLASKLISWHPMVPPGFWDYSQMIVRFSLALILISAGLLFWSLSLARLQIPKQNAGSAI